MVLDRITQCLQEIQISVWFDFIVGNQQMICGTRLVEVMFDVSAFCCDIDSCLCNFLLCCILFVLPSVSRLLCC